MTYSGLAKDTARLTWEDIALPLALRPNPPGGTLIGSGVFTAMWDFTLDPRWSGLNVVMLIHLSIRAADTNGAVIAFQCDMRNGVRGTTCTARQVTSPSSWPGGAYSRAHASGLFDGQVPLDGRCIVEVRVDGFGNCSIADGFDNQSSLCIYPYGEN